MPIPQTPSPLADIVYAKTYNAQWFSGATNEAKITAAIAGAAADGAQYVLVPANMLPYTASGVTFNTSIHMLREGNAEDTVYDVKAYGAKEDGTDDSIAIQAAITAAQANSFRGATVKFPSENLAGYGLATTLTITGQCVQLVGSAGTSDLQRGTLLTWIGGASPMIVFSGVEGGAVRSLCLNNTGTGTVGIDLLSGEGEFTFDHVFVHPTTGFSTAGIRVGSDGQNAIGVYLNRSYVVNCAIGLQVLHANLVNLVETRLLLNTVNDLQIGTTGNAITSFAMFGGSCEGGANLTSVLINNVECASFYGVYFENDGTGYLTEIPSTATLAREVSFYSCRFFGNANGNNTPYAIRVNLSTATLAVYHCYGKNYQTSATWIRNDASQAVMLIGAESDGTLTSIASANTNVSYWGGGFSATRFGFSTPTTGAFVGLNSTAAYIGLLTTITYSASMTPDAAASNEHVITATNGTAFTINAPSNPPSGRDQLLTITVRNTSGGALGAATWNGVYKMSAWVNPANANSRSITFRYDGTNWVEVSRTPADVPN